MEENTDRDQECKASNDRQSVSAFSSEYRHRAKRSLLNMFKIPESFSSSEVESIVDNIILAAVYQVVELQRDSIKQNA